MSHTRLAEHTDEMKEFNVKSLRVGQFSAYYGDRDSSISELLASEVDFLTGDYLAELTMFVLGKNQRRGKPGYAAGFVDEVRRHLPEIARRGVKLVTNAGGLDPEGCAAAVRSECRALGLDLSVWAVIGDDLRGDLDDLRQSGERFPHLDTGEPLKAEVEVVTANAYLGAWPIVAALRGGADIVICPRVTDASLVMGPAAWHFGWGTADFDKLAGSLWAGHAIECGGQITGGNFSFFSQFDDLGSPGMPIAEIQESGDCVITKAVGTGGVVTVDTVKAQLLYETGGHFYQNPDVVADLSSVSVRQVGTDRVQISGAKGQPPGDMLKVSLGYVGGYRNTITVGTTGAHLEEKLRWLEQETRKITDVPGAPPLDLNVTVIGPANPTSGSYAEATAWVVMSARDARPERVGRRGFSSAITQLAVSNIPGFYLAAPPTAERMFGVQWPCLVAKSSVAPRVVDPDGRSTAEPWPAFEVNDPALSGGCARTADPMMHAAPDWADSPRRPVAFGSLFGTRSGDKAGIVNVGVWAKRESGFRWLRDNLTVERLRELIPEVGDLEVRRHEFPNLDALNFQIMGFLDSGADACLRVDPQGKGVGEFLGSRIVEMPEALLEDLA